jgi:hypothetical protein
VLWVSQQTTLREKADEKQSMPTNIGGGLDELSRLTTLFIAGDFVA